MAEDTAWSTREDRARRVLSPWRGAVLPLVVAVFLVMVVSTSLAASTIDWTAVATASGSLVTVTVTGSAVLLPTVNVTPARTSVKTFVADLTLYGAVVPTSIVASVPWLETENASVPSAGGAAAETVKVPLSPLAVVVTWSRNPEPVSTGVAERPRPLALIALTASARVAVLPIVRVLPVLVASLGKAIVRSPIPKRVSAVAQVLVPLETIECACARFATEKVSEPGVAPLPAVAATAVDELLTFAAPQAAALVIASAAARRASNFELTAR